MSSRQSWLRVAGVVMGGVGLAICLLSLIALWIVSARVARVAERASVELEETLVTIGQRIEKSQDRFRTAKLTTQELKSSLGEWAEREAAQRVSLQLQAAETTRQVADRMERADHLLEVAGSMAKLVEHALSMSAAADLPAKSGLSEEISSVRRRLRDATDEVARIQEQITALSAESSSLERIEQAAQFAVRLVASLDWMNDRLEQASNQLRAMQTQMGEYTSKAQRWTSLATLGLACVLLLMALGQLALCRLAWIGGRSGA